MNITDNGW